MYKVQNGTRLIMSIPRKADTDESPLPFISVDRYIGSRIQAVRKAMGITQKELRYRMIQPISQQRLSNYEKGKAPLPAHLLFDISRILGVTAETFLPCTQTPCANALLDNKTLENALNGAMNSFAKTASINADEARQLHKLLSCLYVR